MKQNKLKVAAVEPSTGKQKPSAGERKQSSVGLERGYSGMDRKIERSSKGRSISLGIAALLMVAIVYFAVNAFTKGRSLTIAGEQIKVASVESGTFEDFIPLRARVVPLNTVYLDAVQGGRIEEVLVENGATVVPGQPVVRLSNSDLQLSVMNTESRVIEQLNTMRDQELRLEQNRLAHKRSLVDIDYNIVRLTRDLDRQTELLKKNHISQSEYDAFVDELKYFKQKRGVTKESQASDEKLMKSQMSFFEEKSSIMEDNMEFARKSLDDLNVRAPVEGLLSGFDAEVGQNISRGERIGQIDNPDEFKLNADIDEYYLNRVDLGQSVNFERNGTTYELSISKIYPFVSNGEFKVDLQFSATPPQNIKRGQTFQARLTLGDPNQAMLIPNGGFYQDTAGRWLFVVLPDGKEAVRRDVKLGRRNKEFIEVLSGLVPGEKVVVSSYGAFSDIQRLQLSND
ncbi:MAG: efflux RND transporter periplasmic adaptor subunit [Pseudomonadales bacterium]